MEKNNDTLYWQAVAEGALRVRLGGNVTVTGINRIIKTGRRVKLTGDLSSATCADAERFHLVLQRETDAGWVCVDSCVKMRGGKNAELKT